MANIYEITRNLIEFRGEVKAAQIKSHSIGTALKVGHSEANLIGVMAFLKHLDSDKFTGCIWFKSGSYAQLRIIQGEYTWDYTHVPEIPAELC